MYKAIIAPVTVFFLLLLFAGCGKEGKPEPYPIFKNGVYVVCEGQLGVGNAALTKYNPDSGTVIKDAYNAATHAHLGDIFQSMASYNSTYFFCINNSDHIIATSAFNLADGIATIPVPKPRYTLQAQTFKMYVSTLFSNKVYVVNLKDNTVQRTIALPHNNTEGMLLIGQTAYICTWDTAAAAIYKIDVDKDSVIGSIPVPGRAPQEILHDADGMLWVLSGNKAQGVESMLTRLNPATGAVLKTYSFGAADPLRPVFNTAKDTLYFIEVNYTASNANNGVYRMGIHDATLPVQPFIQADGQHYQYFWGIGIHPRNGTIYVADPKGFTQQGEVFIYRPDGTPVTSFTTGVGPGHFFFD